MLSYRHAFHAGNHADILKHLSWLGVLQHLKQKAKPFVVFDTHAGAGQYPLSSEQAQLNKEYETGMAGLNSVKQASGLLGDYLAYSQPIWQQNIYPGSPQLTALALRDTDSLHCMELHPSEIGPLQEVMKQHRNPNLHVHHRDGLEGLVALTPPVPNRGAVLIDPPYEQLKEYQAVTNTLQQMYRRWANAQTVVWYPLLSERAKGKAQACQQMLDEISQLGKQCFTAELTVCDNTPDAGMYGSGVCIINPAWQLDAQISEAMDTVCQALGGDARFTLSWLKQEA